MTRVRKGQAPGPLSRVTFHERFQQSFKDSLFDPERSAIERVEEIAWTAYTSIHKAPLTQKAGEGFADPDYDLSVEWLETRDHLRSRYSTGAPKRSRVRSRLTRRWRGSCPGGVEPYRLMQLGREIFERRIRHRCAHPSLLSSEYGKRIHPCKGCGSTAMPLCHWPCSCYPNHALGQTSDWMAEIYERWTAAHGVVIFTPVHW
jgi:hypothetical protein